MVVALNYPYPLICQERNTVVVIHSFLLSITVLYTVMRNNKTSLEFSDVSIR